MSTRETWEQIAKIKHQERDLEESLIYKDAFFKTGLRTLINAITTYSQTNEETHSSPSRKAVTAAVFLTGVIWAIWG